MWKVYAQTEERTNMRRTKCDQKSSGELKTVYVDYKIAQCFTETL